MRLDDFVDRVFLPWRWERKKLVRACYIDRIISADRDFEDEDMPNIIEWHDRGLITNDQLDKVFEWRYKKWKEQMKEDL